VETAAVYDDEAAMAFLVPLSDASESCFFFPMAVRLRAVVGWERGCRWCGDGRDDVVRLLKAGRTRDTISLMAA
jgi:hypothetical protein